MSESARSGPQTPAAASAGDLGPRRAALWTSLSVLAVLLAFVRGRRWLASLALFMALLAKEEAVPLPAVLALWAALAAEGGWAERLRRAARQSWPLLLPLLLYLVLRSAAGAYVPRPPLPGSRPGTASPPGARA